MKVKVETPALSEATAACEHAARAMEEVFGGSAIMQAVPEAELSVAEARRQGQAMAHAQMQRLGGGAGTGLCIC